MFAPAIFSLSVRKDSYKIFKSPASLKRYYEKVNKKEKKKDYSLSDSASLNKDFC